MSEEPDLTVFPLSEKTRTLALALQTIFAALPVGSAASVLISAMFPVIGKVQIEWFEYLGTSLLEVRQLVEAHETHLNAQEAQRQAIERALEGFVQRPELLAVILRTTDIAIRDPKRKKWEALRNIVLKNTMPNPPDDDLQLMFMNNMAVFGEWQIRLLTFVNTPRSWQWKQTKGVGGDVSQIGRVVEPFDVITHHIPEAGVIWDLCEQWLAELVAKGLMSLDANNLTFDDENSLPIPIALSEILGRGPRPQAFRLTTPLGQQFLEFIAGPETEDSQGTVKE